MNIFRFMQGCRIASACAVLLLATTVQPEARAGAIFNLGNTDIQGITGPGANQLTTPYATLDFLGNTSTGTLAFTLSTSPHNAGPPINSVFSRISFNTALTLNTDFTLLSASNGGTISGGGNVSSFGTFKYTVGGSSNGDRAQPYTFTLQLTDHSKALASNFEVANGSGNYFAARMFTDIGNDGGVTGFIASNSINTVPEPSTIVMAIPPLGLLVVMALRRIRRSSTPIEA
jgi:hypothetical protein